MPLNFFSFLNIYNDVLEEITPILLRDPRTAPDNESFSVGGARVKVNYSDANKYEFSAYVSLVKVSMGPNALAERGHIIDLSDLYRLGQKEGLDFFGKVTDARAIEKWLSKKAWDYDATSAGNHRDTLKKGAKIGDGYKLKLSGNDKFLLGRGNDDFFSGGGNDLLDGGGHHDHLDGGKGNDVVKGGKGNDVVIGSQGKDTLKGGAGKDKFHFGKRFDKDTIVDFKDNADTIVLNDNLWSGHKSVRKVLKKFGEMVDGDVVLDFGAGDVLTIEDTRKMHLVNDIQIV